ncbi:hypothetical protein ABZV67_42670 [Streptomyces sp. NPDC005065]|uniref:hypothetical protein n=1 Tax=unclassified Streptomyces TaxID=2593676 RepID=UPI0033AE0040
MTLQPDACPLAGHAAVRPKLWGYGTLVSAVGISGFKFPGPFNDAPLAHRPLAVTGFVLWLAGMVAQMVVQRPGRTW